MSNSIFFIPHYSRFSRATNFNCIPVQSLLTIERGRKICAIARKFFPTLKTVRSSTPLRSRYKERRRGWSIDRSARFDLVTGGRYDRCTLLRCRGAINRHFVRRAKHEAEKARPAGWPGPARQALFSRSGIRARESRSRSLMQTVTSTL